MPSYPFSLNPHQISVKYPLVIYIGGGGMLSHISSLLISCAKKSKK